jgi:type IV pilus assembly protein PilX
MSQIFAYQTIRRSDAASACANNDAADHGACPDYRREKQPWPMTPGRTGQRGVALVVALILLLVITLVGLAAVSGTIMQQKMTSNFYDRQIAFQATEGALRQGEIAAGALPASTSSTFVPGSPVRNCSFNSSNHCLANPFTDPSPSPTFTTTTVPAGSFNAGTLAAGQPQYVIEYMGYFAAPPDTVRSLTPASGSTRHYAGFYRITARSVDPASVQYRDRASVTLQSIFRH